MPKRPKHWLDPVVELLTADTIDLRQLAAKVGQKPEIFFRGANLQGADLRGQDLRGIDLSHANLTGALLGDAKTNSATNLSRAFGVGRQIATHDKRGDAARAFLRSRLGDDIYKSWFAAMEFDSFDGRVVRATVPVKFLQSWIQSHYSDDLLEACASVFEGATEVDLVLREPGIKSGTPELRRAAVSPGSSGLMGRTYVNGFEGSPLDPRYTFEAFVVGPANRMAHAAATQVAETALAEDHGFNPLYLHSSVGLGKTHLMHAIAWEVRRRTPKAQVLYLTAERFRYQFVEAIKAEAGLAFKEKFRSIDILLIDDLEFMRGEKTEQEFEHIINSLLDGGRQVVVASARPPRQLDGLNDRMRSRLQRGLTIEIDAPDSMLRLNILKRKILEKRVGQPSFEVPPEVLDFVVDHLTESITHLEGAINRLYLTWQLMRTPVTLDIAETIIRDLVQGIEPRRIKIEDILLIVSRHYAVSKQAILSNTRHGSVVRSRQVSMYLAKHLTSRSLPEIGRRFGNRDHTTVLHAIRKIEYEVSKDPRLKAEIEELKRQLMR